jgi:type I restriction enzyme M protein
MATDSANIVQRMWNYCNVLRDDGVSYGDYVEQLTYLLFLKMADEQTKPPFSKQSMVPKGLDWPALKGKSGDALETQYRHTLESLGKAEDCWASSSARRRTRFRTRPSWSGSSR